MTELKTAQKVTRGGSKFTPLVSEPNDLLLRQGELEHRVDLTPVLVGRDRSCTIQLVSTETSRFHAAIFRFGKKFMVRDLHSTNGVTINGDIVRLAQVRPGDRLAFSDEAFVVEEAATKSASYSDEGIVLFIDVAGFTALSELHGNLFVETLRQVFDVLEDKVLLRRGCPIKNLGDGLMAAFGIWPVRDRRYSAADEALSFAQEATEFVRDQTHKFFGGATSCDLRFGMAFGDIGYHTESGLDLLGDTVNMAARLESINKLYGTRVMVNEPLHRRLREKRHLRELDTIRLKGKTNPVTIWAVDDRSLTRERINTFVGPGGKAEDPKAYLRLYSEGLDLYRSGEFRAAGEVFAVAADVHRDPPAACMRQRLQRIVTGDLALDAGTWDGIWSMETK